MTINAAQETREVMLKISDPWELGEAVQWGAFPAVLLTRQGERVLLAIKQPFEFKGMKREFFVASPRHRGDSVNHLYQGRSLFCGMSEIARDLAMSENPFDTSKWIGGIALIGELEPL
ncbi:MAG: hypothetical protein ACREXS_13575 [Gammaproteobacteria bacterium]